MVGGIEDPIVVGGIKELAWDRGFQEPIKVPGMEKWFDSSNKLLKF